MSDTNDKTTDTWVTCPWCGEEYSEEAEPCLTAARRALEAADRDAERYQQMVVDLSSGDVAAQMDAQLKRAERLEAENVKSAFYDGVEGYEWLQANLPTKYLGMNVVNAAADWIRSLMVDVERVQGELGNYITNTAKERGGLFRRTERLEAEIKDIHDALRDRKPVVDSQTAREVYYLVREVARLTEVLEGRKDETDDSERGGGDPTFRAVLEALAPLRRPGGGR